jgi:hypothetical protein
MGSEDILHLLPGLKAEEPEFYDSTFGTDLQHLGSMTKLRRIDTRRSVLLYDE